MFYSDWEYRSAYWQAWIQTHRLRGHLCELPALGKSLLHFPPLPTIHCYLHTQKPSSRPASYDTSLFTSHLCHLSDLFVFLPSPLPPIHPATHHHLYTQAYPRSPLSLGATLTWHVVSSFPSPLCPSPMSSYHWTSQISISRSSCWSFRLLCSEVTFEAQDVTFISHPSLWLLPYCTHRASSRPMV